MLISLSPSYQPVAQRGVSLPCSNQKEHTGCRFNDPALSAARKVRFGSEYLKPDLDEDFPLAFPPDDTALLRSLNVAVRGAEL